MRRRDMQTGEVTRVDSTARKPNPRSAVIVGAQVRQARAQALADAIEAARQASPEVMAALDLLLPGRMKRASRR